MRIYKTWSIITIFCLVLYIALIFLNSSASNTSDILKPYRAETGIQNFSLAYDSQEKILLVGTYQNKLIAFDEKGDRLWEFIGKGPFREMKVDSKKRRVYAGCEDRNVYILDLDKGTQAGVINVQRRIYSIDINKEASLIAVSAGISAIKHDLLLYDGNGNEVFKTAIGATSKKVVFNSDETKIILGTDRAEIILFDLMGNELKKTKLNYEISDVVIHRDLQRIAVITKNMTYYLLDEDFNRILSQTYYGEGMSIAVSKDLNTVALGNKEGNFYVVDREGSLLYTKKVEDSVTGILFTENRIYMTGLGNFVYYLERSGLTSSVLLRNLKSVFRVLLFIIPFIIIILLILSIDVMKKNAGCALRAIYKHRTAYLMLIPTFALLLVFNYYPVFIALIRSFTDWSIRHSSIQEIKFIGLDNFKMMFTEGYFLLGVKNLLILLVTSFIKVLTIPLLVAELVFLMKNDRQKYWFRFLFVVPMVVPAIVGTLMWYQIYDPSIGLINNVLRSIGLENLQRSWLGDPSTAIWAIVFMGFPFINAFAFLVYYGGLIDIPSSLFEAARVDGSNGWWNFTRIHLPLVTPQIKMLLILQFIGTIQEFSSIFILTGGGPGVSTYVPGLELFYNATRFGRYGYACALGLVMFVVILGGTILNMRMRTVSEYND